jgi:hypothetical protein
MGMESVPGQDSDGNAEQYDFAGRRHSARRLIPSAVFAKNGNKPVECMQFSISALSAHLPHENRARGSLPSLKAPIFESPSLLHRFRQKIKFLDAA